MSFNHIPAGDHIPEEFNVIIEVPANGKPTKYEVDKELDMLVVDRFMPSAMHYPANYGYVPSTLADDGDPVDVLVLCPCEVQAGVLLSARAIGMLHMTDEKGEDSKILAVPTDSVCIEYAHIKSLDDVSPIVLEQITHFFTHYKELEPNKWVKVREWVGKEAAHKEIMESVARYQQQKVDA